MKRPEADLAELDVAVLEDHPQNPRFLREDVVTEIANQLIATGEYRREHAITVRPANGSRYQVISGHHRKAATLRAGLKTVFAWVTEMDDATAYMELILANSQSELSPIEIGTHALHYVAPESGGRGKKGGLTAYAERIGKARQNVALYRDAARVLETVKPHTGMRVYADKALHLAAIHKLPDELWPVYVDLMVARGWSRADTEAAVEAGEQTYAVLEQAQSMPRIAEYLPLMAVITKGIEDEFSARTVQGVIDAVRTMYSMIEAHDTSVNEFTAGATEWLIQNSGGDSWSARRVSRYAKELENEISNQKLRETWACGDCADLISDLENESVRLVVTDPPYGVKYQSNHRREQHKLIAGDTSVNEAMDVLSAMLTAIEPKLEADAHLMIFCSWRTEHRVREVVQSTGYSVRGSYIWDKQAATAGDLNGTLGSSHERIVHAVKGKPLVYERDRDVLPYARVPTDRHPTEKPVPLLKRLIETMTARMDLVVDPFGGVASTLVAAKECGRGYWGCEFDEKYHAIGGQRLAATREGD